MQLVNADLYPAYSITDQLPALQKMRAPKRTRSLFRVVVFFFFLIPFGLLFIPWQQTITGRGRVIAFQATERQAILTSLNSGVIKTWHVREGQKVTKGSPVVDIEDTNPNLAANLEEQKSQILGQIAAARDAKKEQEKVIGKLRESLDANLNAAREAVQGAKDFVSIQQQALEVAKVRLGAEEETNKLIQDLVRKGLRPAVDGIRSQASRDAAENEVSRSKNAVDQAQTSVRERQAMVAQREADGLSSIATATRSVNDIQQTIFTHERSLQDIENRIERFNARFIKAPYDCTILRIEANVSQGGAYVKEGDPLLTIVPDTSDLVVELWIDGVDAPLIQKDENGIWPHVRLQFEGWPALQFSGWPSVARGTFGGRIRQIDATDNGAGQFRVFVEPDALFDNDQWPPKDFLRQGNQAIGWVFLNRVTLGWELWRRLNGFPPVLAPQEPEKPQKDKSK